MILVCNLTEEIFIQGGKNANTCVGHYKRLALIVSVATLVCSIVVYVKLRKSLSDCETTQELK